jgi:hypothetical protein
MAEPANRGKNNTKVSLPPFIKSGTIKQVFT